MERKQAVPEHPIFLRGRRVNLRPLDAATDLATCVRWMNDEKVRAFLAVFLPVTPAAEAEWFANLAKRDRDIILGIETAAGRLIGVIALHRIDWKNRNAETGTCIGERAEWGKGYGTEAKLLLLRYAFMDLGFHKVHSRAYAFNERSIRYSLKCGYRIEGRLRDFVWKEGRYWDAVELGVLREEWETAQRRFDRSWKRRNSKK